LYFTDHPGMLVLWDVDDTLVDAGTVWRDAYAHAFAKVTGTNVSKFVPTDEGTELILARKFLRVHHRASGPNAVHQLLEQVAAATFQRADVMRVAGTALSGAADCMAALATGVPRVRQSVLTGNVRSVAASKLALFKLTAHLDLEIGVYGDDVLNRSDLVSLVWERASIIHGAEYRRTNTVIIADAILDVVTATKMGTAVVAVATGKASSHELFEAGAATVLTTLSDPDALVEAVYAATRAPLRGNRAVFRHHPEHGQPTVSLSAVVMAHPSRASHADLLAAGLGLDSVVLDPEPDAPPSPMRTALKAWRRHGNSNYHLVIQDDILAPRTLLATVSLSTRRHSDSPLAFYSHWNSQNGALVRLAALAGAGWTRAVPNEYVPTQALCLPSALGDAFVRHAAEAATTADDVAMSKFLETTGHQVLLSVPNLVEHVGDTSLAGNSRDGLRRSACYVDRDGTDERLAQGWILQDVPCLPYIGASRTTRLILNVLHQHGQPEQYLAWRDALPQDQLTVETVEHHVKRVQTHAVHRSVSQLLGDVYTSEFWVYSLLLGWRAELASARHESFATRPKRGAVDRLVEKNALFTIGFASLDPASRATLTPPQALTLYRYARHGSRVGRRIALTGVTTTSGEAE